MHTTKKREKKTKKQKSHYSIPDLTTAIHAPPRQHLKYKFSKKNASKKGMLQHRRRPTNDFRFSLQEWMTLILFVHDCGWL
jgi:hypothetical protein